MSIFPRSLLFIASLVTVFCPAQSQTSLSPARQLENLIRQEGEVYLAIDRYEPSRGQHCRLEDVFTNSLLVSGDSLTVPYTNHTEFFCEAYVLHSQFVYQIGLHDIDLAKLTLVQRNYNYGAAKFLEGQVSWFEVLIPARQGQSLVRRRNITDRESDTIASIRLICKTKEGATKALVLLRQLAPEALPK